MTKQNYIKALLSCNTLWIMRSFQHPNKFMTQKDLVLHAVAYRRLTGINLFKLEA
jgi:hypothetical protein